MKIRTNIIANLLGRTWAALMSFAFVPVYLHFLGIEAYAMVGFFAALMGTFVVLDLGLGITINREFARLSDGLEARAEGRAMLRTLEAVYWSIALFIGVTMILTAPMIVRGWINTQNLSPEDAVAAMRLMGLVAFFRWPVALYLGALAGLRRQVLLNAVTSALATVSALGASLVLWLVAPNIKAFFWWQVAIAALQVIWLRSAVWNLVPLQGHRPALSLTVLRAQWKFSAGVTGIALFSTVLTQSDKLVVSKMLKLSDFGYYSLAGGIAAILLTIGASVESAAFPALSKLYASDHQSELAALYHRSSNALAILVIPAATTLSLFAPELLSVYLRNPVTVGHTHLLLSLLVAGNAALAMMFMPLALQLAAGWTRLSFIKNVIAVVLFVPAMLILVRSYGAPGAAMTWIGLTFGYILIEIPIMHSRLLPGEQWRWYLHDVGGPLIVSLAILGSLRLVLDRASSPSLALPLILLAAAAALGAAGLASSEGRSIARNALSRVRGSA